MHAINSNTGLSPQDGESQELDTLGRAVELLVGFLAKQSKVTQCQHGHLHFSISTLIPTLLPNFARDLEPC